jgi:hypothetical protein
VSAHAHTNIRAIKQELDIGDTLLHAGGAVLIDSDTLIARGIVHGATIWALPKGRGGGGDPRDPIKESAPTAPGQALLPPPPALEEGPEDEGNRGDEWLRGVTENLEIAACRLEASMLIQAEWEYIEEGEEVHQCLTAAWDPNGMPVIVQVCQIVCAIRMLNVTREGVGMLRYFTPVHTWTFRIPIDATTWTREEQVPVGPPCRHLRCAPKGKPIGLHG